MNTTYIPTLTIAGSDSSGGAGIQADIKTMSALGCYAMSVITAITAQNTCGVMAVEPISPKAIEAQLHAVIEDIPPMAIKTGMLYDAEVIKTVSKSLKELKKAPPVVVDPVMIATSGDSLLQPEAVESLIKKLLPIATLVTPNIPEAEVLSGIPITSRDSADEAAKVILTFGVEAVLIKGGHSEDYEAVDLLYTADGRHEVFKGRKINTKNTHGTGCTLSSAIASYMAQGFTLEQSIKQGKVYLTEAIISGKDMNIGNGHGPVDHFHHPVKSIKI